MSIAPLGGRFRPAKPQFLGEQGSVNDSDVAHHPSEEVFEMPLVPGQQMRALVGDGGSKNVPILFDKINARQLRHERGKADASQQISQVLDRPRRRPSGLSEASPFLGDH